MSAAVTSASRLDTAADFARRLGSTLLICAAVVVGLRDFADADADYFIPEFELLEKEPCFA
jgi:hypothetical protein